MRERIEFTFFQCLKWLVLLLPLKSAQRLGWYFGSAAYYIMKRRRNIALDNLRHAFPEKSDASLIKITKGVFRNYGVTLVELLWFPNLTAESINDLLTVNNVELLRDAYTKGKGVVVLAGHFGNWELIALGAACISQLQFTIIVQTQSNSRVDAVINRHRCLFGNKVVPMGMSVREIIRTLSEGGIIAMAPDQSGPAEGVFVNFFGRTVATHQGPASFVLRSGAPLIMGFIIRKKDMTYEVVMEEIATSDLKEYNEENILELTRRHTSLLESYVRRYPDHWLWLHRRWKHIREDIHTEQQTA